MSRSALLIAVVLVSTACREQPEALDAGATVRDSAGVTIVRSREPLWASPDSAWRIADTQMVDIGGPEGYDLRDIVDVVRTPAGAIAAADGGAQIIKVFALDGRRLRSLGSRGTGTGQFQAIDWIAAAGDSIVAFDLVARRLTMFNSETRVRTASFPNTGPVLTAPLARFDDGTLLVVSGGPTFPFSGKAAEVQRDSAWLLRYGTNAAVQDTIMRVAWGESFGVVIGEGDGRFVAPMPRPFARRTSALLVDGNIVVGEASRYVISVYDSAGRLLRSIRRDHAPAPVTQDAIEGFKEARRRAPESRGLQAQVDSALIRALGAAPYPSTMPAYERVLGDAEGNLWVLDYSVRAGQESSWDVFDPRGRWLGTVRTPARFRVEQIGTNWILGVWRDAEDAERVRMYEVIKP